MNQTQIDIIIAAAALLASFIKVPKLELNLWGLIGRAIKEGMLKEVNGQLEKLDKKIDGISTKVDSVEKQVKTVDARQEQSEIIDCRSRILSFGDEIANQPELLHSHEHFKQIVSDIDKYENYCRQHPEFKNNLTKITNEVILDTYRSRFDKHDFK